MSINISIMKKINSLKNGVYMGIDPSISSTGFCVIDDQFRVKDYGRIQSDKDKAVYSRIQDIKMDLLGVIDKNRPEIIVIEGLSFGSGGKSTRDLAGLFHVIVNTLMVMVPKCKVYVVSPKTSKKRFSGKGTASKEDMQVVLGSKDPSFNNKLDDIPKTKGRFDVVDAYALVSQVGCLTEEERVK